MPKTNVGQMLSRPSCTSNPEWRKEGNPTQKTSAIEGRGKKSPRAGEPTLADVAAMCGFSTSTVSNVIRGAPCVTPKTRRKVLQAIEAINYRPNILARNLVQKRTSTVGLVLGDLSNTFYAELAGIIERRASSFGYATLLSSTGGDIEAQRLHVEKLLEHRVGGIIALQFISDEKLIRGLRAAGVPLVVVGCWEEHSDCVAVDDERGGVLVARHLLGLGHHRLAYVGSNLVEPATDAARLHGYQTELSRLGIDLRQECVLRWEFQAHFRNSRLMLSGLRDLLSSDSAPTAFFASNDIVAISLIETLDELGRGVPDDVSVVGFDDIAVSGLARVSLTTIAQPCEELGRIGVQLLFERLDHWETAPCKQIRLYPHLVVRSSAGPRLT